MDANSILEILNLPNGVLAVVILGVIYAFKFLRDDTIKRENKYDQLVEENKQEARQREDKLMDHLERYDESLGEINNSIQGINTSLSNLTDKVDDLEKKIR